jgi:NitT/TauT family transport system substrate-binding protein
VKKTLTLLTEAICALFFPFSFAACHKGDTLKINEVTHSVFYAPLYLADALGYLGEENIQMELTNGGGADKVMAAVLSGEADVGFCGPEAALYTALGGSTDSPKVFGQLTKRDGSFLVSRLNEKQNFSWSNLQGKSILAGRKGGVPAMTFAYILSQKGVSATLNYDVSFNMMTSAFQGGVSDYCTMFEPTASDYEAAGYGYIVASVGEASGEIPYTCFIAKQSYLSSHADKIEGLLRAVTKAIKYVNETDDTTIASYLAPYFDGTTVSSLATSVKNYKAIDAWVTDMAMQESAYENLLTVIDAAGELSGRVDFANLVVTQTAHKVYTEIYAGI